MRKFVRKLLLWLLDKTQQKAKEPFGAYFTVGIQPNGQAPIQFMWNSAFIQNLEQYGYQCATEEETIELFYVATRPTNSLIKEPEVQQAINSDAHPMLSDPSNIIRT
jgi:hypothetical protein